MPRDRWSGEERARTYRGGTPRPSRSRSPPDDHELRLQSQQGLERRQADFSRQLRIRFGHRFTRAQPNRPTPGSRFAAAIQSKPDQRVHTSEDEEDRGGLSRRLGGRKRSSPSPPTSTTPSGRRRKRPGAWRARARRILNEPTAAALAYGLENKRARQDCRLRFGRRHIRPFHSRSRRGVFEVLSTNGDTFLGGEDFDTRIMDYLADEFPQGPGH